MILRSIVLAVVMFLGSVAIADAQTFVNGGVAGQFTALGWNYGHVSNCYVVVSGSTTWFYAGGRVWLYEQSRLCDYIIASLPNWKLGWRVCH